MNGAIAEPWDKTIKPPNTAKTMIIGKSQYFFLTFINSQNSLIKLILNFILILCFLPLFLIYQKYEQRKRK